MKNIDWCIKNGYTNLTKFSVIDESQTRRELSKPITYDGDILAMVSIEKTLADWLYSERGPKSMPNNVKHIKRNPMNEYFIAKNLTNWPMPSTGS